MNANEGQVALQNDNNGSAIFETALHYDFLLSV